MYMIGNSTDTVYQYTLATPWNIGSATYDSISKLISSEEGSPRSIAFKPDGTKMYIVGYGTDSVYQYNLRSAWDIETASNEYTIYASIHVLSGTGTLDAVVESDNNSGFTTPTTRITFTQATGITGEWKTLEGPVTDDYWRLNYTIGGDGPFSFVVFFGIL
jgi:hypothetical protein